MQPQPHTDDHGGSWLFSRAGMASLVAVSILGLLIFTGHGLHVLGWLPYLLILSCPLMHFFMHGGHRHDKAGEEKHTHLSEER